jgi:signal transduction histidine kinase
MRGLSVIQSAQVSMVLKTALGLVALGGLYLVAEAGYTPLFHTVIEMACVVMAAATAIVGWSARSFGRNGYVVFIGAAMGSYALLVFLHALSFPGVQVIPSAGRDESVQLWVAAGYIQALAFLAACLLVGRTAQPSAVLLAFSAITAAALLAILVWDIFPECFRPGSGFTPFKVASEYTICGLLGVAGVWLLRRRQAFDRHVLLLLTGAIGASVASQWCLAHVAGVSDAPVRVGHLLKLVGCLGLYKAVVETGLLTPHRVLFRELKQREEQLAEHGARLEETVAERTQALRTANTQLREEIVRRERLAGLNEATLAAVPAGLLVLDADLNVIGANWDTIEGVAIGERLASGQELRVADILPAALIERADLDRHLRAAVTEGTNSSLPCVAHPGADHPTPWHEDRFLDVRIRALRPAAEAADPSPRVVLTLLDITEQVRLEEHARQSSRLESIGTLAGGIAHDFNNILTGILGYADILRSSPCDAAARAEHLDHIDSLARRAADLTGQLLTFCRRQPLSVQAVDVNERLTALGKMLDRIIGEHILLRLDLDPESGQIRADPTQFEQVIMNLAVNARDAMPAGGRLTITSALPAPEAGGPREHVRITVRDTGCGMDQATRERIFEPFFTTKDPGKGTGLGLATVYGIVAQHEGRIVVDSAPGLGSAFHVYLPRVSQSASETTVTEITEPVAQSRSTILVVEDEQSVLDIARRSLERRGHTVLTATGPTDAGAVLRAHEGDLDLLVTDVVMPGADGPSLYRQLVRERPELRVLYMSGHDDLASAAGVGRNGSPAFIQKPFTPLALAHKVQEVLRT